MTEVTVYKTVDSYFKVKSEGHADGGEYEEIVCAAISVLTQGLLDILLGMNEDGINYEIKDGYLSFNILDDEIKNNEKVKSYFEFFIHSIKLIETNYPKYLKYQEVLLWLS